MSFLNQNSNALHASPGPAPVLDGVSTLPGSRHAPFSQPFVPTGGGPSEPPVFNLQILRSLRMHATLALLVGLAVGLLLVALGLNQPRTYTASSVIYVEPMVARNLNEQGVPGFDQFRYGSFLDQQIQTIVRPDVLTAALRTLPPGTWRGPLESEQSAVARLSKALTVERVLTSYQITVQLKASDPQAAAAIVNAVTTAYLQRGREDEFKQADLREQILSEERDRVKQELETDRKEQAALGASMGLASPADGAGNPYDADLANLRAQLATAREARDVAAAQLASVSGQDSGHVSGLTASADDLINTDPGLSAKKAAVNARRVVLETQMAGMTPSNPQYRQAQDEIADLNRALEAQTAEVRAQTERRIQDKLRTDLARTADVESKINAQLAQATAKATGAGPKLQRAAELSTDIQRLTARYTTVDDALNALELETSGPGMAHVPLPAAVPLTPDANHRDLFFIAALPLGLFCGVSAAVIARLRDRRVYLGADLQHAIGFAPIAVLPARADVSERVIDEYVLRLAAGVESAYRTTGAKSFVVTAVSADTDTGTLLRDLARKLEDLRLRVLVVRASELLVTSQETMEHQAATAALIAAGAAPPPVQPGEGIASAKLDRMKSQNDIVLIDAAPVLHSAETEYASRCADATILVAESAITQTTELAAATALLSRLRVAGVGAVLDQVKLEQADTAFREAVRVIEQRSLDGVIDRKPLRQTPAAAPAKRDVAPAQQATPAKSAQTTAPVQETTEVVVVPGVRPKQATPAAIEPATSPKPVAAMPEPVRPAPASITPAQPVSLAGPATAPGSVAVPPRPVLPAAPLPVQSEPAAAKPTGAEGPVTAATETKADQAPNAPAPAAPLPETPAPPQAPASAAPVAGGPPRVYARPPIPQRSFKNWTAFPEITPEESEQVLSRPGVRERSGLPGDVGRVTPAIDSAPSATSPIENAAQTHAGQTLVEPRRTALQAAAAKMQINPAISTDGVERTVPGTEKIDDPHAVGRFISEKDKIGAVPSYTRSKIRLAFKEQEVNSKTTWFSKLFRGDPPATFKIVPDDTDDDVESTAPPKLQWEKAPVRLPEPVADGDPELSHLLNRIKTSGETKIAPRPQPVAFEPEPVVASGPPVPFVERRTAPRPIEIEEFRAPAAPAPAPAAAASAAQPAAAVWQPPVSAPLTPPLAAAPPSFVAPAPAAPAPAYAPPVEPANSGSRPYGRPLRPLTFQQLAGSIEAEALHEQPRQPEQPVPEAAAPAEPKARTPEPEIQGALPAAPLPVQQTGAAPVANEWELPTAALKAAAAPATPATPTAPVHSDSHTGMPMWPAKEPIVSAPATPTRPEQSVSAPLLAAEPAGASEGSIAVPEPLPAHEQPAHASEFLAPSPSARRGNFERIPIVPDPLTDPAPSPRPYRLEPHQSAVERLSSPEPAPPEATPTPAPVATVPPGTSFPPDHEARLHMFARRRSDLDKESDVPGMTRRWKLLSQFEPVLSDPLPAHRKGYTRSTDANPPRRSDEA